MLKPRVKTSEFQSAFHPVNFLTCIYLKYNISYYYSSETSTQCDKADNLNHTRCSGHSTVSLIPNTLFGYCTGCVIFWLTLINLETKFGQASFLMNNNNTFYNNTCNNNKNIFKTIIFEDFFS